jgi:hypothetical protein
MADYAFGSNPPYEFSPKNRRPQMSLAMIGLQQSLGKCWPAFNPLLDVVMFWHRISLIM